MSIQRTQFKVTSDIRNCKSLYFRNSEVSVIGKIDKNGMLTLTITTTPQTSIIFYFNSFVYLDVDVVVHDSDSDSDDDLKNRPIIKQNNPIQWALNPPPDDYHLFKKVGPD